MAKAVCIGGRIEWNGFRVANLLTSLPASVRADFIAWLEGHDKEIHDKAFEEGRRAEREWQMDDHR